jgi:hypothetical protein
MKPYRFELVRLWKLGYTLDELQPIAIEVSDTHATIDEELPEWVELRTQKRAARQKAKEDLAKSFSAKKPYPIDSNYDPAKHKYVGRCCS